MPRPYAIAALAVVAAALLASVALAEDMRDILAGIGWSLRLDFNSPADLQTLNHTSSIFDVSNATVADSRVYNLVIDYRAHSGVVALIDARVEIPALNLSLTDQGYIVVIATSRNSDNPVIFYAPMSDPAHPLKAYAPNSTLEVRVVSADGLLYTREDIRMRALSNAPPGYQVIRRGSGDATFTYNLPSGATRVCIWFDESHSPGDVDLFVFRSSNAWFNSASHTWSWSTLYWRSDAHIFADFSPQTRCLDNPGSRIKLVVRHFTGTAQWVVAVRVIGGSGGGGGGGGSGGSHATTVTQTVTQTVTNTQTVTVTQPRYITVTQTRYQPMPIQAGSQGGSQELGGSLGILGGQSSTLLIVIAVILVAVALAFAASGRR